jgi:hypothetical protein
VKAWVGLQVFAGLASLLNVAAGFGAFAAGDPVWWPTVVSLVLGVGLVLFAHVRMVRLELLERGVGS